MSEFIKEAFKKIGRQDTDTTVMEVLSVDKQNGTCTCFDGEMEHYDVRLSAIIDESMQKFYLYPVVGSTVLVTPIDEDYSMQFIAAVSEVEQMYFGVGACKLEIDQQGFLLQKENETLKQLMSDLLQAIKAMTFTTNSGPTIKLINAAQFTAIENRFNNFLKGN